MEGLLFESNSRNWDDEFDEEEVLEYTPAYSSPIFLHADRLPNASVLLIGISTGAYFLHCSFPNKRAVGSLVLPEISMKNNTLEPSINDRTCILYEVENNPHILLVLCQYEVQPERSYIWTSTLFNSIKTPQKVYIFDKILDVDLSISTDEAVNPPLLRKLETSKQREENIQICPFLPLPNIVEKLAAAILTHCEIHGLCGSLFVSLQERSTLGEETFVAFEPVLSFLKLLKADSKLYNMAIQQLRSNRVNPLFL